MNGIQGPYSSSSTISQAQLQHYATGGRPFQGSPVPPTLGGQHQQQQQHQQQARGIPNGYVTAGPVSHPGSGSGGVNTASTTSTGTPNGMVVQGPGVGASRSASLGPAGSAVAAPAPAPTAFVDTRVPPKIYKRQRIAYEPVTRPLNNPGAWDLEQIEEIVTQTQAKRPRRTIRDLGLVDTRTLMMCLRSRIGSEVAYALNTLTVLSSTPPQDFLLNLSLCTDLVDELMELYEDVVEGRDDEDEPWREQDGDEGDARHDIPPPSRGNQKPGPSLSSSSSRMRPSSNSVSDARTNKNDTSSRHDHIHQRLRPPSTYTKDQRRFYEDEFRLGHPSTSSRGDPCRPQQRFAGMDRATLALGCTALLRNLTLYDINVLELVKDTRLLSASLLLATGGEEGDDDGEAKPSPSTVAIPRASNPIHLSRAQRLQARKDVLQIIGNLGYQIQLEQLPRWISRAIVELTGYFLEPNDTPAGFTPERPPLAHVVGPGMDTALLVLSRIALSDANRDALSKLPPTVLRPFILSKFAILIDLLPLNEFDFQFLTTEPALLRMELVAMGMYNLVYIAQVEVRKRLRESAGILKVLTRVIKKLYTAQAIIPPPPPGSTPLQHREYANASTRYSILCQRCIEVLRVLTEDEMAGNHVSSSTGNQEGVAWFGGHREEGNEGQGSHPRTRPSLLFARQDFLELLAMPVPDKALFTALAECCT